MIRPFTFVTVLMALGSGLYLYQAKHRSQLLDRQIAGVVRDADRARTRIGTLRTEWGALNDPERLTPLADRHLSLQKTDPRQFTTWADLDRRLPAVAPLPPPQTDPALLAALEPYGPPAPTQTALPVPMPPTVATAVVPSVSPSAATPPAATASSGEVSLARGPSTAPAPASVVPSASALALVASLPGSSTPPLPAPSRPASVQRPAPRPPTPSRDPLATPVAAPHFGGSGTSVAALSGRSAPAYPPRASYAAPAYPSNYATPTGYAQSSYAPAYGGSYGGSALGMTRSAASSTGGAYAPGSQ